VPGEAVNDIVAAEPGNHVILSSAHEDIVAVGPDNGCIPPIAVGGGANGNHRRCHDRIACYPWNKMRTPSAIEGPRKPDCTLLNFIERAKRIPQEQVVIPIIDLQFIDGDFPR
jgi:hypothetical protein